MNMNRRSFFGIISAPVVIGGISFKLDKPITAIEKTKEKPVIRLLEDGFYKIKIVDIKFQESKMHSGEINIHIVMCELESKVHIHNILSPRAPWITMLFINKFDIPTVHDSVDLSEAIGREAIVYVEKREFNKKYHNNVNYKK